MDVITKDGVKFTLNEKIYRQSILLRDISEETEIEGEKIEFL